MKPSRPFRVPFAFGTASLAANIPPSLLRGFRTVSRFVYREGDPFLGQSGRHSYRIPAKLAVQSDVCSAWELREKPRTSRFDRPPLS